MEGKWVSKLPSIYDSASVPRDRHRIQKGSVQILHRQYLIVWQQSLLQIQPVDFLIYPIPVWKMNAKMSKMTFYLELKLIVWASDKKNIQRVDFVFQYIEISESSLNLFYVLSHLCEDNW